MSVSACAASSAAASPLALMGDGTVPGWGNNSYGQANVPAALTNAPYGAQIIPTTAVVAGNNFSIALTSSAGNDGAITAWGDNSYGQCNDPAGLTGTVAIAAGAYFALALASDGTVTAWGDNSHGQCNVPGGLHGVVAVKPGDYFCVALKTDGTVATWGDNTYGETNMPPGLGGVIAIAAGNDFCLALKTNATVVVWGDNTHGQTNVPAGLGGVVSVAAGNDFCVALKGNGTVAAWGDNTHQQTNIPAGLSGVIAVAPGNNYCFALIGNGTVVAWGDNGSGETNVPAFWSPPAQSFDTWPTNAAYEGFTAGVILPDNRFLVADQFGLRVFDVSRQIENQAATYLVNDLTNLAGTLAQTRNDPNAWHLFLQTIATYGLSSALAQNDALHGLLFGNVSLLDTASATATLNGLITSTDWRSTHTEIGSTAPSQIATLQALLLNAVMQSASQPNPANLPLVSDTLSRLNLLLATHGQTIPPPSVGLAAATNHMVQMSLNGYPYVHYALQSSTDLSIWTTNSGAMEGFGSTNVSAAGTRSKYFRGVQTE